MIRKKTVQQPGNLFGHDGFGYLQPLCESGYGFKKNNLVLLRVGLPYSTMFSGHYG